MTPLIERLDMIVNELEGLPHVVQTCREAAERIQSLEAELDRVRALADDNQKTLAVELGRVTAESANRRARQALSTGER